MPHAARGRIYGYVAILLAAIILGMWASVGKLVVEQVHPLTVAFYVQLLPGLLFLPLVRPSHFQRSDLKLLAFTTTFGAFLGPVVYFLGIQRTTAANAALLSNTEALFTILFAFALLGERLSRRGYGSLAVIAGGAFLVVADPSLVGIGRPEFLLGNLLLVGAACTWGLSNNGVTILSQRTRILSLISVQLLLGSSLLMPVLLVTGAPLAPPPSAVGGLVFLSLTGIAAFTALFYYAFRTIGAMRAGAVLATSALWGVLIALAVFPDQPLTSWQIVGGALMMVAVVALYAFGEPHAVRGPSLPPMKAGETLKPARSDERK